MDTRLLLITIQCQTSFKRQAKMKNTKIIMSVDFTDINLTFGVIVAESNPQRTFRGLTI